MLYESNSFKFVKVTFMTQDMVYLCDCSIDTGKECVVTCSWVEFYLNQLDPVFQSSSSISVLIFYLVILSIAEDEVLTSPPIIVGLAYFSSQQNQFLLHVF